MSAGNEHTDIPDSVPYWFHCPRHYSLKVYEVSVSLYSPHVTSGAVDFDLGS